MTRLPVREDGTPIWTAGMQNGVEKQLADLKKVGREEEIKIRKGELTFLWVKRWARCSNWNHIGGCTR